MLKKCYTEPAISPANPTFRDLKKNWFVWFRYCEGETWGEKPESTYSWKRFSEEGYEVSSAGDKSLSALTAKLPDGRMIEEAYQLDVKGYRSEGDNWKLGKGKPPKTSMTKDELWNAYKDLWKQYFDSHPATLSELESLPPGTVFTDKFAKTEVSHKRICFPVPLNSKILVWYSSANVEKDSCAL